MPLFSVMLGQGGLYLTSPDLPVQARSHRLCAGHRRHMTSPTHRSRANRQRQTAASRSRQFPFRPSFRPVCGPGCMQVAPAMRCHRTPGILPALLFLLAVLLLLSAGAAPTSAQRHRATCRLEIIGNGGAFAAVLEHSRDSGTPAESFRVATQAQALPGVRSISLRCSSPQGPITVGVNTRLVTHKQLEDFSGVEVVDGAVNDVAKACGFVPWSGADPEPEHGALLFFCGNYHVVFDEFSIQGVQLMHQLSKQRRDYLVVFGGGKSSSVSAAINKAQIINSAADSALVVAGSSRVNVSSLRCSGNMGRDGACISAWNAAVVRLQHSSITNCSAAWGGGVAASNAATVAISNSSFVGCRGVIGGGIDVRGKTRLNVSDSRFVSNRAWSDDFNVAGGGGGAVAVRESATALLLRAKLINNTAVDGGAIAGWCDHPHSCSLRLAACVVQGNNATWVDGTESTSNGWGGGGTGGGLSAWSASVVIADSVLLNNTAWSSGGAVYLQDSTLALNQTKVACNNASTEESNADGYGGGLYCLNSSVTVTGCNISFNSGWDAGGGLCATDSNITVLNSTMLNNTCTAVDSAGGLLNVYGTGAAPLEVVFGDNTIIQNSHAGFGGALYIEFNSTAAAEFATNRSKIIVNGSVLLHNNSASTGQDVIVKGRPFLHVNGQNIRISNSSVMRRDLCAVGDSRSADGFCGLCPGQLLSLDPNYTQLCQPCPDHATCVGGAVVVADSGFFNAGDLGRSCNLSTIIRCPNPLACKHNTSAVALHQLHPYFTYMTTIDPLAPPAEATDWTSYTSQLCDTGYRGLLCGNCQDNFGQTDAFSCSACLRIKTGSGDGGINTRGIWGLLAAYAIICVAIVWSTVVMNMLEHNSRAAGSFKGDKAFRVGLVRHVATTQEESDRRVADDDDELQLTDVIKALIMYAQYFAGIIGKLPVAWPNILAEPIGQLSDSWSRAMGASASLDCVLKTLPAGIDPAGLKALINLLMPLAMLSIVLLCQTVWWACKRQCVWLLATSGLHVLKLLRSDGSAAGSTSARISKFKKWCIQRQFYASMSRGWLQGVCGLGEYLRQRWVVSLLVTVFFFYPSVVRVAVGMFTCITVCDQRYWVMNLDKSCPLDYPTSVHGGWAFGVGIPALLILVAVPVSVAWLLWVAAHKHWLDQPWFQQQFGFMFSDYQSEVADKHSRPGGTLGFKSNASGRPWSQLLVASKQRVTLAWDAVIHMQTVVLVFMSVFGLVMHEYWQTLILAAVFGSYLLLVLWLQPFRGRYTQRLQAQSTAVLFATCCLVLTFIPPEGMDERQHRGYKRAADVTATLLLALNIAFVAYGLVLMLRRLSQMLQVLIKQQRTAGPPVGCRQEVARQATAATTTAPAAEAPLPRCIAVQHQ